MYNTHQYGEAVSEFEIGARVATHPATHAWLRGERFGEVVALGDNAVVVRLDRSQRAVRFVPRDLAHMTAS
ncbi:RNA binding protein [Mycobacterium Phage Nergal]|nr:RNA binding protein [Mycobacterium Phage Nergal]